jgi:hypothetical protein
MQLIERLKQKQMRQRKAYQQLEAVLALGTRWVSPWHRNLLMINYLTRNFVFFPSLARMCE